MSGENPLRLRAIDHVVLRARNVDRMERFYTEVLGCTVVERDRDFGLHQLRAGASLIDLLDMTRPGGQAGGPPPGPGRGKNVDHFAVQVAPWDEAAIRAWLGRHDVKCGETLQRNGAEGEGPAFYIEDPEGNQVELKGPAVTTATA